MKRNQALGSKQHNQGFPARAQITLPTVKAAQEALDAHELNCPGSHFECYGKPRKERARVAWIEEKHHRQAVLAMAQEAERSGWKDADGNNIDPLPWRPELKPGTRDKAAEMRDYRARKAAGTLKKNGRPKAKKAE